MPNAPKHQPCDTCGKWVKRVSKVGMVAEYYCLHCQTTTVVRLKIKKSRRLRLEFNNRKEMV